MWLSWIQLNYSCFVLCCSDTRGERGGGEGAGQGKPHRSSPTHSSDKGCNSWKSKHPQCWQAQVRSRKLTNIHIQHKIIWKIMFILLQFHTDTWCLKWFRIILCHLWLLVFRFQAPGRDEESESQRKARSRLLRQTRRSTQVLLIMICLQVKNTLMGDFWVLKQQTATNTDSKVIV